MADISRVLVVSPHPDDAEFGIGGTVARWTRQGVTVRYIICTDGSKGSDDPAMTPERLVIIREKEQLEAAKVLGVSEVIFLRRPDLGLEDTEDFRRDITRLIRLYRPDLVATCDPYRRYLWHRDHRITGQVVLDAVYPLARNRPSFPELLQEGLEPHKVREVYFWAADNPNYCSDISKTFDIKMAALRCHHSQLDHVWSQLEERLRQRCQAAATGRGFPLGEAFYRLEIPI
jgi:LmbE family N-acetylglucosaminyl deacetylase